MSPPSYLVGRGDQLDLVHRAMRERGAVEFTGPCGAGQFYVRPCTPDRAVDPTATATFGPPILR
ncbi:hypothetical protein ACWGJB_20485 [Streptomyces sp. NPDC054813]